MVSTPESRAEYRRQKLRRLMRKHELSSRDVEGIIPYRAQTVRLWMCGKRNVPLRALQMLDRSLPQEA